MIRVLKEGESVTTRNFGGFCPYYYVDDDTGQVIVGDTAEEIISSMPKHKRKIDPAACLSLLCFVHLFRGPTKPPKAACDPVIACRTFYRGK